MPNEYLEILSKLQKAIKYNNKSEVRQISIDKLRDAKNILAREINTPAYALLIQIISEKEKEEEKKRQFRLFNRRTCITVGISILIFLLGILFGKGCIK